MPAVIPETNLGTVTLRPAARAVDTFVRASAPRQSDAMALAQALADFQPGIRAYLRTKQDASDAKDAAQARKDALTEARMDIAEVQKGDKFAQRSAVYVQTYKQQRGLIEGQKIRTEALKEYAAQGLENSTDPAEFDTFLGEFLKTRLESITDEDLLSGALGVVEQTANNMSLQNAARVSANIQTGIMEDAVTLVGGSVDSEIEAALREKRDFDPANVMAVVNTANARTKFLQLPGNELRKQITDLVIDKAVANADPSMLAILDQKMDVGGGKTLPLADGYWKTKKDEALMRVQSRQIQISDQLSQQADREAKARLQQGQSTILTILAKNPYAQLTVQQLTELEAYAPGLGEQALTLRNKLIEGAEKRSPQSMLRSFAEFAKDPSDLGKLFAAAPGLDASMIKMGLQFNQRAANYGEGDASRGWRNVLAHPSVAPFMARFDAASTDPILKDLTMDPEVLANSRAQFNDSVMEYMEKNPDATRAEVRKYVSAEFSEITTQAREATDSALLRQLLQPKAAPAVTPKAAPSAPVVAPLPVVNPYPQFDEAE